MRSPPSRWPARRTRARTSFRASVSVALAYSSRCAACSRVRAHVAQLNEIEGVDLAHSSLVMVPIVQLLIRDSATGRPHVSTLAINGQPPSVPTMPGIAIAGFAPPPRAPASVGQRIAGLLGMAGPPQMTKDAPIARPRFGRPCAKHPRPGQADAALVPVDGQPWRHVHGFDPAGFNASAFSAFDHHRAFHGHHGHHRHGRHGFHLGCLLRRIGHVGTLVFSLLVIKLVIGLGIGLAIARAARARRAARHAEETDGDSEKTEPLFLEEDEELPAYADDVKVVIEEKPARDGDI